MNPHIDASAYIARGAVVIGDVELGAGCGVWFNAVVRGDIEKVRIGARTNIQDCAVVHVSAGNPCIIGDNVTAGHQAVIHGCRIGDNCVVGIGATVLDGAIVGEDCIIAAGSVVTHRKEFPPRSFILGTPARAIREVTSEEIENNRTIAAHYVERAAEYAALGY